MACEGHQNKNIFSFNFFVRLLLLNRSVIRNQQQQQPSKASRKFHFKKVKYFKSFFFIFYCFVCVLASFSYSVSFFISFIFLISSLTHELGREMKKTLLLLFYFIYFLPLLWF